MPERSLSLDRHGFAPQIADVVREARELIGWTQRELASRAGTSQATIWRLESGSAGHLDLVTVERILAALGIRARLELDARHLADRRRQRDAVHARLTGYVARRLEASGWMTATEVAIGDPTPRGWIDLLAFRSTDAALIVEESKTEIVDLGATQRSLAFYEREALAAAHRMGWRPSRVCVALVALDSDTVAASILANRDLVAQAFPARSEELLAWIVDPRAPRPRGWSVVMADPATRRRTWLVAASVAAPRRRHAYASYADAAARLRLRR